MGALDTLSPLTRKQMAFWEPGETLVFTFQSVKEAVEFLSGFDPGQHLDTARAPTILTS